MTDQAAHALPPLSPSREEFHRLAAGGNLVPVYAEVAADLDTPLSAFLRLRPGPYAFLLESVEGGEKWARYSFLGSEPSMVFTAKGRRLTVRHADGRVETLQAANPFEALRALLARFKPVAVPGLPRFQGGAVGFLSYDMVRHVEKLPRRAKDDLKLPDAVFMFTDSLLVFDNLRHRLLVIGNAHITGQDPASLDRAYDEAVEQDQGAPGQARASRAAAGAADLPGRRAARRHGRGGLHLDHGRGDVHGARAPGQGVHRLRRRLPDRGLAAAGHGAPGGSLHRLPGAAHASTRRRTSSSCGWARRASSAPRPRCSCASKTTASRSGPSRARTRAAGRRRRTTSSRPRCSPTPRSAPST